MSDNSSDANNHRQRGVWYIRVGTRRLSLGRSGTLMISRVYEQTVLGLTSILLAWRLGVREFAPVSLLLIINSLCVVGSNFGLATDLIGRPLGDLSKQTVVRVRQINIFAFFGAAGTALIFKGSISVLLTASGLIWLCSAEAFIRKSALLRLDLPGQASLAEITGSSTLLAAMCLALVFSEHALLLISSGLVGKHVAEVLLSHGWWRLFADSGRSSWSVSVWVGSMLNFAIGNVDFVIIAIMLSSEAFSIYSLGFRIAAALVAQIGYVMDRVALADFGEAHRAGQLGASYVWRRRQMFFIGLAAGSVTATLAPVVPHLIGADWKPVTMVIVVLSIAVPWRMSGGIGVMSAIAVGQARLLVRWETIRLGLAAVMLVIAGFFGLRWFTITASLVAIFTTVGYDRLALEFARMKQRSWMLTFSPVAVVLVVIAGLGLRA